MCLPAVCSRDRKHLRRTPEPLWPSSPWRNLDPDDSETKRVKSTDGEVTSGESVDLLEGPPHGHDDDAGLGDDVLVELVEGGVGVVVEALQLLLHVVQLEKRAERRAVGAVGRRRVELEDGVVLTQSLLDELREEEKKKAKKKKKKPENCLTASKKSR